MTELSTTKALTSRWSQSAEKGAPPLADPPLIPIRTHV
jgi:hypothetical protein